MAWFSRSRTFWMMALIGRDHIFHRVQEAINALADPAAL
jgi:hypothetical protein